MFSPPIALFQIWTHLPKKVHPATIIALLKKYKTFKWVEVNECHNFPQSKGGEAFPKTAVIIWRYNRDWQQSPEELQEREIPPAFIAEIKKLYSRDPLFKDAPVITAEGILTPDDIERVRGHLNFAIAAAND